MAPEAVCALVCEYEMPSVREVLEARFKLTDGRRCGSSTRGEDSECDSEDENGRGEASGELQSVGQVEGDTFARGCFDALDFLV